MIPGSYLVLAIIPMFSPDLTIGVGFFYSGLLRRKNALSMIYLSMMTLAVVSFEVRPSSFFPRVYSLTLLLLFKWFFWGFSLAFSETGSRYIGNLSMSSMPCTRVRPQTFIHSSL